MRRTLVISAGAFLLACASTAAAVSANGASTAAPQAAHPEKLLCSEGSPLCAESADALSYEGQYTGHDEPSLLFYSDTPGAGNNQNYRLVVPQDPPVLPRQDGTGGTFNFQDRIAFWFGMDLCDNQSAPEFTHDPCTPNSDTNIFDGADPTKADYIGRHPGTAFLELQFYPPGWVPFQNAISCDATKWCAAMAIFSFNSNQNTGVNNNAACLNTVGDRAGELRVHHQERHAACAGESTRPDARVIYPQSRNRPVHGCGRRAQHLHPRLRRRSRDLDPGPHDRRIGIDDGERRERVRPDQLRSGGRDVHADAVRIPPDVLDVERAHPGPVGGPLVQRGLLR